MRSETLNIHCAPLSLSDAIDRVTADGVYVTETFLDQIEEDAGTLNLYDVGGLGHIIAAYSPEGSLVRVYDVIRGRVLTGWPGGAQ